MRPLILVAIATLACAKGDRSAAATLAWESWRAEGVVGDTLGESNATIGTVLATTLDSRGNVLVLDGAEMRVLAFDAGGQLRARSPGAGDGPGELRDPVAIVTLAGDSVAVADRTLRRIEVLSPVADGLRPVRSFALDFSPSAACLLDGDLFVLGGRDNVYLHRMMVAGTFKGSWSPVPADTIKENADAVVGFRRFALGDGALACDADAGLLVHAPWAHTEVYGIRADGRIAWTQTVDSLVMRTIVAVENGVSFALDPAFGYGEDVQRVTPLHNGQALLLIRRRFAREANRDPEHRAIVIDVASGVLLHRMPSPRHYGFTTREWALEHLEDPAPAVRRWRR
ncbi:MAG: hypothetical protein IT357_06850 [Gemmatimonadaceae bacterium]|nr:hypothetical protein [Gemmatimonadaceae bacterium]